MHEVQWAILLFVLARFSSSIILLHNYPKDGQIHKPCPSKTLEANSTAVNPADTHWTRPDQLILHGIVSAVAVTVVTHHGSVTTAKQAWDTLKTMYAGHSRVHIMALKQRISNFSKGTQSMAVYLQGVKVIYDELSIIDHPLDDTDLVIHTLNGLSVEYRELSTALRSRETIIDFAELHEKLIDFETIIHGDDHVHHESVLATAHAVTRHKGSQRPKHQSFRSSSPSQPNSFLFTPSLMNMG